MGSVKENFIEELADKQGKGTEAAEFVFVYFPSQ